MVFSWFKRFLYFACCNMLIQLFIIVLNGGVAICCTEANYDVNTV